MRTHAADPRVQRAAIGALCHTAFGDENALPIQKAGGIELVFQAVNTHISRRDVLVNACNFIRAMACYKEKAVETCMCKEGDGGAIQCLLNIMTEYPQDADIQTRACAALWNVSAFASAKVKIHHAGGIPLVLDAMTNHPHSAEVQEHAIGVLWNLSAADEERVAIAVPGGVALIAKAMETHQNSMPVQREGLGALYNLSCTQDGQVRLALTTSRAIPALQFLWNKHYDLHAMMHGNFSFETFQLVDKISETLNRLGVIEDHVIGDDDYDADEDEGEYPIESPPFDIGDLLDKDLAATNAAPGWYCYKPFCVDDDRSVLNETKHQETDFLHVPKEPAVGQQVCLRIVLPYGGRGYLYGTVTKVSPVPTNDDLKRSDFALFGKPCPCPRPACPLKNGTREELLYAFGVLHGQEVTATMSLHSDSQFEGNRKLRFKPLPEFFRGESAQYDMVIRFDDKEQRWKVVRIFVKDECGEEKATSNLES